MAEEKSDIGEMIRTAKKLEGSVRNTGIHACGVIITPDDITNFVPVSVAKDSELLVSQYDNSVAEDAGLLKMDFLGLKTLTIIKDALEIIKERYGADVDIENPCLNPAIVTPAQGSRESSTRPMIAWRAAAGVSSYRLQLVSREPEGRTLASIDTLVNDTRFLPPQALGGFALVSVRVTSLCPEGAPPASSPAREHRFLIDARSACAVSGLTLDSLDAGEKRIRWPPTPAAGGYEIFS